MVENQDSSQKFYDISPYNMYKFHDWLFKVGHFY